MKTVLPGTVSVVHRIKNLLLLLLLEF